MPAVPSNSSNLAEMLENMQTPIAMQLHATKHHQPPKTIVNEEHLLSKKHLLLKKLAPTGSVGRHTHLTATNKRKMPVVICELRGGHEATAPAGERVHSLKQSR